jgi:hypothetical protein
MLYWFCFRSTSKARRNWPCPYGGGAFSSALQILISAPPLRRQSLLAPVLPRVRRHGSPPAPALGADPAPVAHQAHGPEQIPLDHEAVEAPDPCSGLIRCRTRWNWMGERSSSITILVRYHLPGFPAVKEFTMDDFGGYLPWLLLALGSAISVAMLLYGLGYIP